MKTQQFKSLTEFINKTDLKSISKESIFIFDIDGVFFEGIFDPREIIGIIDKTTLSAFEIIVSQSSAVWILTNRYTIFKKFPFIRQITRSIKKVASITPNIYSNCSDFLGSGSNKYNIIMHAKKPGLESQKVLIKALKEYKQIIYIGGDDKYFPFTDEELVNEIPRNISTEHLTFIKII